MTPRGRRSGITRRWRHAPELICRIRGHAWRHVASNQRDALERCARCGNAIRFPHRTPTGPHN